MSTSAKAGYRPDIDGLRAVAILPVVLFHLHLGCPGGYVGVDVFFVISGYLISLLLLRELAAQRFHLADFWERRIRRIFPAAATVVVAVIAAAWFILEPGDFSSFGQSVVAQALLASNLFFWKTSGYFFGHPDQLPLLHTWSLAVEEQFYLFFPPLLLFLHRFRRGRLLFPILGLLAALSFAFSLFSVSRHPQVAFYLLPARAWELLFGALLHGIPSLGQTRTFWREGTAWLGFGAVLTAILIYSADTPFPGLAALLPVVGSALIIWANTGRQTSLGRILALPPLVFIGLVSYSLYLWHWPLIVFAKYISLGPLTGGVTAAILCSSIVLASLSWLLIETPVRRRRWLPTRRAIFLCYLVLTAAFVGAGLGIAQLQGIPARFSPEALRYLGGRDDVALREDLSLGAALKAKLERVGARPDDPQVDLLVWGDSHAMAVVPVLDTLGQQAGLTVAAATHGATPPLLDYVSTSPYSLRQDSPAYSRAVLAYVIQHHVRQVLLVARWELYVTAATPEPAKAEFEADLDRTLTALHQAGARVAILLTVPTYEFEVPRALARSSHRRALRVPVGSQYSRLTAERQFFAKAAAKGTVVLDPTECLLDPDQALALERDGRSLYADSNHLSIHGAALLTPLFQPLFRSR